MSVKFTSGVDIENLTNIYKNILSDDKDAKAWKNEPREKIVNLSYPIAGVIRLRLFSIANEIEDNDSLLFQISDLSVPFRQSEKTLNYIAEIIEKIIKREIKSAKEEYTFKVNFGEGNPYFGLFVKRLRIPNQELRTFHCEFVERRGKAEAMIDVSAKRISMTTNNSFDFRNLSSRYVSLASIDFSNSY